MARPRTYDRKSTLQAIKETFWSKGYEAASLSDLEAATRLNKQSLYREFGDKRGMYLAAIDAYLAEEIAEAARDLASAAGGSAVERFARFFEATIRDGDGRGCFICNAGAELKPGEDEIRARVEGAMLSTRDAFARALKAGGYDHARAETAAARLLAGYYGLKVMIKAGAPADMLRNIAEGLVEAL